MNEFRILAHGMLGYGFPRASLDEAVRRGFDLIAVDAGSTDPGPYYLGSGLPFVSRPMVERDLDLLLAGAAQAGAVMVIGSAGGAGTDSQVEFVLSILRELIRKRGERKRVAIIRSEVSRELVHRALQENRIRVFETDEQLTSQDIDAASHIVAQIGLEPLMAALEAKPDIVVAGRAWDVANVAALPVSRGFPRGLALHLGKILECGGQAAVPVEGSDLLMGRLFQDRFIVESPNAAKACTVESISAHTLYEKANPVRLPGPGGIVDLVNASFEQIDPVRVQVRGSAFEPNNPYTVKLEGARLAGCRHIAIGGIRDPIMIRSLDKVQEDIAARLAQNLEGSISPSLYSIHFHRYGMDGVMGRLEPVGQPAHEVGLLIDVVGETREIAESVCAMARSLALHWGYEGRIATAGNLAFPFSPADLPGGEVYAFNIYHLMEIDDPVADFPYVLEEMG